MTLGKYREVYTTFMPSRSIFPAFRCSCLSPGSHLCWWLPTTTRTENAGANPNVNMNEALEVWNIRLDHWDKKQKAQQV